MQALVYLSYVSYLLVYHNYFFIIHVFLIFFCEYAFWHTRICVFALVGARVCVYDIFPNSYFTCAMAYCVDVFREYAFFIICPCANSHSCEHAHVYFLFIFFFVSPTPIIPPILPTLGRHGVLRTRFQTHAIFHLWNCLLNWTGWYIFPDRVKFQKAIMM